MEPMPIMRTNFHRGSHKKVVSQGRHETHFPDASIPPNETHRNYANHVSDETHAVHASHDFYGTRKMYANRWGCGNHSKNVNHILDVTH